MPVSGEQRAEKPLCPTYSPRCLLTVRKCEVTLEVTTIGIFREDVPTRGHGVSCGAGMCFTAKSHYCIENLAMLGEFLLCISNL